MPFTYNAAGVLGVLQAFIIADLTAQSETPAAVPYTFTAAQYGFDTATLPLTLIEIKHLQVRPVDGADTVLLSLGIVIHHVRARGNAPGGVTELTALSRLAHIGASMQTDFHLASANGGKPAVQNAQPQSAVMGEDNPVQAQLDQDQEGGSLCAASLAVLIDWYERA